MQLILSELQQERVWDGWLTSEMRAYYFTDLCGSYRKRQTILTWATLICSSGAATAILADWSPQGSHWPTAALALCTAVLSLLSLVEHNSVKSMECSDLYFRFGHLAADYEKLWDNMYADDAVEHLQELTDRGLEISELATAFPYREKIMLKWQDHVEKQHGCLQPSTV